jgi:cysteinyl-tRNA synthetase
MKKIYLYNTLTRQKEEFKPINHKEVGIYTCGPTVYNYAHIGNLRSYIFADILVRSLKYNYGQEKVKWVMNITDVDDKTIRDSKIKYFDLEPMKALKKFTNTYEDYFWIDMEKLNVSLPDKITHAADEYYIGKMQLLVLDIVEKGFGYIKDGSVYFNVKKYSENYKYGQLINLDVSGLKNGASVDADEYEKDNIRDFVLWKGVKEGEPSWNFEINGEKLPGRPGWHIECSAMGEAELGMPFDVHTGGIDLKFPHHENEIAQSVIGYNLETPIKYWLHNEFLMVDGVKMSKRFNNFYTLRDMEEKDINSLAFRFLCLQTGYGKVMNFTFGSLEAARNGLEHLYNQIRELGEDQSEVDEKYKDKFISAVNDDLNIPEVLAVLQEMLKSDLECNVKLATALDFDKVLGLKLADAFKEIYLPHDIKKLVVLRDEARSLKNFDEADTIRKKIEGLGYIVEDTKEGKKRIKKIK